MIACMEMRPQHRDPKPAAPAVIAPSAITLTTPPLATNTIRPAAVVSRPRFETLVCRLFRDNREFASSNPDTSPVPAPPQRTANRKQPEGL